MAKGAQARITRMKNNTCNSNNVLQIPGVQKTKSGKYNARVSACNKQFSVGSYDTPEQAGIAYEGANRVIKKLIEIQAI